MLKVGKIDPNTARALIDSIKWRLAKMLPRVYGERSHLEVSGELKLETVKDRAPEWMAERLAGVGEEMQGAIKALEAETVH